MGQACGASVASMAKTLTAGASGKDLPYCSSISPTSTRSVRASTAFSNRERVGGEQSPAACGVRAHTRVSNGSGRRRSASLQSAYPKALWSSRCRSCSRRSGLTLRALRSSGSRGARRSLSPRRSSLCRSNRPPPARELWGASNATFRGTVGWKSSESWVIPSALGSLLCAGSESLDSFRP